MYQIQKYSKHLFQISKTCLGSTHSLSNIVTSQRNLSSKTANDIVLVDGVRTPFLMSHTTFENMMPHELLSQAYDGLMNKVGLEKSVVDYICAGTVFQEPRTSNVAKEAAFKSGFPLSTTAHTVTMACISANQAMTSCAGLLYAGVYDVAIAGGVEFCSDTPIRYSRVMRQLLTKAPRAKTPEQKVAVANIARGLTPRELAPELPDPREFTTNEVMGHSADRLARAWGVSRQEQDEFALRSHTMAADAFSKGLLSDITPVTVEGVDNPVTVDNGVRPTPLEKMAKLKPAFIPADGSVTAANSSFLSDGASACLMMTEQKAKELGLKPKAYIRQFTYASQDPKEELLLGPAYATPKLLKQTGLTFKDFDVFEFHEAFAAQILANLNAINSDKFCQENWGMSEKIGLPPMEKFNTWGGSLSIGHPFGATGVRLAMHAANRLIHEDGNRALISACAAGAQGVAMIIERHPDGTL